MNKFLIRTPLYSTEYLNILFEEDNPTEYIYGFFLENIIFQEAIYLNSRVLYRQALKYAHENNPLDSKKRKKAANALIRYFLRMSYRATPFGLSAGISLAAYKESSTLKKITYKHRSVKIDSAVISAILKKLNSDINIREAFTFYSNNTLFLKDSSYRFFEKNDLKSSFDFSLTKVETNDFLDEILQICSSGATIKDIRTLLQSDEELELDEIEEFIEELINSQLIVSNLQYDVLNVNFEEDLLARLKEFNKKNSNENLQTVITLLSRTKELCLELENLELESDQSFELIKELDFLLDDYNDSESTAVQVDLIQESNFSLPIKVKKNIEKNISVFHKLNSQINKRKKLTEFKREFLNRYGKRAVSLLEVLDLEIGIGYPLNVKVNAKSSLLQNVQVVEKHIPQDDKINEWDKFLLEKYEQYLSNKTSIISINAADLNFIDPVNTGQIQSMLFSAQLYEKATDEYEYFVSAIRKGTAQFSAGRFAYRNTEMNNYMNEVADYEKKQLSDNQVYAEVKHYSQPRLGNISQRPNHYDYFIPIYDSSCEASDFEIALSDLYLYIEDDTVILYSFKLNKQVIPKLSCAQNTALLTCSIYNFLGEIMNDSFMTYWDWGFLKNKFHLPRVQFKDFILSKERWILNPRLIYSGAKTIAVLKDFISSNSIKRYVTLNSAGDNFLPLDLKSEISINLIHEELLKDNIITLEESVNLVNSKSAVENNFGNTTNEIHIPILPETAGGLKKYELEKIKTSIQNKDSSYKLFPDKSSLYFKIYIKNEHVDKIFIEKIFYLLSGLVQQKKCDYYFYIRYKDPDYHFRIRLFSEKLDIDYIVNCIKEAFKEEIDSFIVDKIQIDTYERETERYGGAMGIQVSEKMFYYDSVCVLETLLWIEKNDKEQDKWLIAMQGVHHLFQDFLIAHSDRIKKLEQLRDYYYEEVANRSEVNKQVFFFFQENKESMDLYMDPEKFEKLFFTFFKTRSSRNKACIDDLIQNKISYSVENYIHMFLNRFFENNPNQQELIIYDLLIRYYKTVFFKSKNL
ncbi:thiopeptide-type bacteriocin biosynthesis protein [Flavobacterium sp. 2755]|uniref:lantibiotic dehydratase n=1 Tax=Flavobacterium sp. 2755 TaxID=2817765 RepID=UPI00285E1EFB|nr:lantibiotic dehydratase [Flavobacterium sp. 2755]MDR6761955.1 thiopeptide-type bacteriocin biosynthesis protein [Flavobacterium sp. 2755]